MLLAALIPVLAPLLLLGLFQMRASRAMPLCFLLTVVAALCIWQVPGIRVAAATLEGWVLTATILWILFGALILLNALRISGAMDALRTRLAATSPDRNVQLLLVAWLFGSFLESVAGFGTPAAICAPLLVALGFPAMGAVFVCLAANSVSVAFGAAGTPVLIGLAQGLQTAFDVEPEGLLWTSGALTAGLNVIIGSFIPLLLIALYARFFSPERSIASGLSAWKPALLAGFAFTVPAFAAAFFFGPEFPSLLGSMIGFAVLLIALRRGWIPGARGSVPEGTMSFLRAAGPYLWLAALLSATRLIPQAKQFLQGVTLDFPELLGTEIGASFAILYSPGTVFLLAAAVAVLQFRLGASEVGEAVRASFARLLPSAIALGAALPMVRVFIHSGDNALGLPAMPLELARVAAESTGAGWPFFAPFVGALGSFLSGSATFSNLMFALLQLDAARATATPEVLILALQAVGAGAGNMISVLNVVAAAAVVGLAGREGAILRLTAIPMLYYCVFAGALGLLLARVG